MKMSGFTPADLIKEVKIRPGIYDKDALIPPRKAQKQQLWLEVAESLTPPEDWMTYTEEEKELRVAEVSKKWTNLRDIFHREVKLLESGESNKRKYVHFNEMEFVRPYIGYKQPPVNKRRKIFNHSEGSSQNFQDDDSDIDMDQFLKSKEEFAMERNQITAKKSISGLKNTSTKTEESKSTTRIPAVKQNETESFQILNKANTNKNPRFNIRESDISFCLSLVPTLQKMCDVRKLSAKIDILKVLHKNMIEIQNLKDDSNPWYEQEVDSE